MWKVEIMCNEEGFEQKSISWIYVYTHKYKAEIITLNNEEMVKKNAWKKLFQKKKSISEHVYAITERKSTHEKEYIYI